jgi:hypothetical protein
MGNKSGRDSHESEDCVCGMLLRTLLPQIHQETLMFRPTLLITTFTLSSALLVGCNLYVEDGDSRRPCGPGECGQDSTDPDDGWGSQPDGGFGWTCTENVDCAAGCYCDTGDTCQEGGFCDETAACPEGFECDDRASCVPIQDLATCQGAVSCDVAPPLCPTGSTPTIEDDCYSGTCMLKADCPDGAPFACSDLNENEAECLGTSACSSVYKGIDCTSDTGSECSSGSANCNCESFVFDYCEASP